MERVHCVGVLEKFLLISVKQKRGQPIRLVHLLLDDRSASLTSPLYEHDIEMEQINEEKEEFRLLKWHSFLLRIKEPKDEADFMKQLRKIVKQSFFPLLKKSSQILEWQKEFYCWEIFFRGLPTQYINEFILSEWLEKKIGEGVFWTSFTKQYKSQLKEVLDILALKKENIILHQPTTCLFGLMDRWSAGAAPYFRCRLMEMSTMHALVNFEISLVSFSSLNIGTVRDLLLFYQLLESIEKNDDDESFPTDFNNLSSLLQHSLHNKLPGLLKKLLTVKDSERKRRLVLEKILLPRIITDSENKAAEVLSTLYPVTVKAILFHFCLLFDVSQSPTESYNLKDEEVEVVSNRENIVFDEVDIPEVLRFCLKSIPLMTKNWEVLPLDLTCEIKSNRPLFLICLKTELNKKEQIILDLFSAPEKNEVRVVSDLWDVDQWQRDYLALDELERSVYEIRFIILLCPLVAFNGLSDMKHLDDILSENIFETIILRPSHSQYTVTKCRNYFSGEKSRVDFIDFRENFYDIKQALTRENVKSLIVILDAHLFSIEEMLQLMHWFQERKGEISRVVMMGVSDTLPLHCDGHAFLDLIQHTEDLSSSIFQYKSLHLETLKLCEGKSFYLTHNYRDVEKILRQPQQTTTHRRRHGIQIFHILSSFENTRKREKKILMDSLRESLTVKFSSNNNVHFSETSLAELYTLPRTQQYDIYFFITMECLKRMTHNEWNHLLLETDSLIVCTKEITKLSPEKLVTSLLREPVFPNLRYTLHYKRKHLSPY
jgi:hypothetical protein